MQNENFIQDLPGQEFALSGLQDLAEGRETEAALLLEIAAPRLSRAGLVLPPIKASLIDAEFRLYRLLEARYGQEAYSQYGALLGRLRKFSRALESRALWWNIVPLNADPRENFEATATLAIQSKPEPPS